MQHGTEALYIVMLIVSAVVIFLIVTGFIGGALRFFGIIKGPRKPSGILRALLSAVLATSALSYAIIFADYDPANFVGTPHENVRNPAGGMTFVFLLFALPVVPLCAAIARYCSAPRGYADIGVGLATGALFSAALVSYGGIENVEMTLRSAKNFLATPLAGALGGFVYWRTRGYPGASEGTARKADTLHAGAALVQAVADRDLLTGVRSARTLRNGSGPSPEVPKSASGARRPNAHARSGGFGRRNSTP